MHSCLDSWPACRCCTLCGLVRCKTGQCRHLLSSRRTGNRLACKHAAARSGLLTATCIQFCWRFSSPVCARPLSRPDLVKSFALACRKGSYNLAGTGLHFNSNGVVVREAMAALRARRPNTRLLLSVGGSGFTNWSGLNITCLKNLVADYPVHGGWCMCMCMCGPTASGGKV